MKIEGEEHKCKYVSSKGLMRSCDIIIAEETYSELCIENHDFTGMKDGMILYVNTARILQFSLQIDKIPYKFILVSGNSDLSIPYEVFNNRDSFLSFINNEKLIHWFSQNCLITDHPKLSQMPIGLDYHLLTHTKCVMGDIISSIDQELELENIKSNFIPFWERNKIMFSNFHYSLTCEISYMIHGDSTVYNKKKEYKDRYDAINNIPRELIYYQPTILLRKDSWNESTNYSFIVSPPGNGLDCHRTWEGLCLGSIVVIKSSILDPLYEDLPVLIVKDWSEITRELLEITIIEYKYRKFNYDKLTLKYWVDKWKKYLV